MSLIVDGDWRHILSDPARTFVRDARMEYIVVLHGSIFGVFGPLKRVGVDCKLRLMP